MKQSNRITGFDVIRIFACLCVTIVHFNATVSQWTNGVFVYSNSIIPNHYLENRLYLGSIGVSLFFILSGASLMLSAQNSPPTHVKDILVFYKKRAKSIYPMFWTAFAAATIYDFLKYKQMAGNKPWMMLLSLSGLDGHLANMGVVDFGFYKVGEWFLGCLILIYVVFPLLYWGIEKHAGLFFAVCIGIYAGYIRLSPTYGYSIQVTIFFLRIPEFLMGMLLIKYNLVNRPKLLICITTACALAAWLFRNHIHNLTFTIACCTLMFALILLASQSITSTWIKSILAFGAKLTYPVFLIHHWLSYRLVEGFNLVSMPRRSVFMLFAIYMLITLVLSYWLICFNNSMMKTIEKLLCTNKD